MARRSNTPFDSIESTQDYLRLLSEELNHVLDEIETEREVASASASARYLDAVRLAHYKLSRLRQHILASRRIVNDIHLIKRLFDPKVDKRALHSADAQPLAEQSKPIGL